jgi:SAM-dependent methyltransferase
VRFESSDVGRYYDQNTSGFLAHGQGGAQGIIHRAVWGEGVGSRGDAFHFVHDLLRARIAVCGARSVLDLGCGVGASLEHVLRGTQVTGFGVTNSRVHAELARERLGERAAVSELDFCSDPLPAPVDLAFGIESFVQAPDAEAFLANVAKAVATNGYLVLCDDFKQSADGPTDAGEDRWVREFRRGWRASSLLRPDRVDSLALKHGFVLVEDRDLTPHLELNRPRDRALALLIALMRPLSSMNVRLESHLGGNALRQCLKRGLVAYRYRVFKATGSVRLTSPGAHLL